MAANGMRWCLAAGPQCTQYPTAFISDQMAIRTFDVLQTQKASTQCPKAFIADQLAMRMCCMAFNADQLAIRTFDVLQAQTASTPCPKAFIADQLAMRTFNVLQTPV